jgi:hypothetical protein
VLALITTLCVPALSVQRVEGTSESVFQKRCCHPAGAKHSGSSLWDLQKIGRPNASPLHFSSLPKTSQTPSEALTQTSNALLLLQQGIELYDAERFFEAIGVWQQAASAFANREIA